MRFCLLMMRTCFGFVIPNLCCRLRAVCKILQPIFKESVCVCWLYQVLLKSESNGQATNTNSLDDSTIFYGIFQMDVNRISYYWNVAATFAMAFNFSTRPSFSPAFFVVRFFFDRHKTIKHLARKLNKYSRKRAIHKWIEKEAGNSFRN